MLRKTPHPITPKERDSPWARFSQRTAGVGRAGFQMCRRFQSLPVSPASAELPGLPGHRQQKQVADLGHRGLKTAVLRRAAPRLARMEGGLPGARLLVTGKPVLVPTVEGHVGFHGHSARLCAWPAAMPNKHQGTCSLCHSDGHMSQQRADEGSGQGLRQTQQGSALTP